jgi:transcriptional activator of cad operon
VERRDTTPVKVGDWCVNPTLGQISRDGKTVRVEARTMRLLVYLAEHAGEVVSVEELLTEVWAGVVVTSDSVYQAVTSLRKMLGDDVKEPTYILTVPRLGYRLIARVSPAAETPVASTTTTSTVQRDPNPASPIRNSATGHRTWPVVMALAMGVLLAAALVYERHQAKHDEQDIPSRSVAVLPFLDLTTQEMTDEYLADGMTEELIDRLSRVPGLRVPAPTASFYFKGKRVPMSDIGKSLRVTYLLDGSIRKSGSTLRVSARLVRALDGYVLWSGNYDRSANDKLELQDEIASSVSKAVSANLP